MDSFNPLTGTAHLLEEVDSEFDLTYLFFEHFLKPFLFILQKSYLSY